MLEHILRVCHWTRVLEHILRANLFPFIIHLSYYNFSHVGFPLLDFLIKILMIFSVVHLLHTNFVSLYAYRDKVVSVEIWLQSRWFGIRISAGAFFFLLQKVRTGSGAYPASSSVGTESSPRVKRQRLVGDNSPASSPEVKNAVSYTCSSYTSSWRGPGV